MADREDIDLYFGHPGFDQEVIHDIAPRRTECPVCGADLNPERPALSCPDCGVDLVNEFELARARARLARQVSK